MYIRTVVRAVGVVGGGQSRLSALSAFLRERHEAGVDEEG